MAEAASRHGYAGATVARVIELAGVSRATFYEHFASREDCFLAAYRLAFDEVRLAVGVVAEARSPEERPGATLDVLLEEQIADLERRIELFLDDQPLSGAIQIPATALLAGNRRGSRHPGAERGGAGSAAAAR